MADDDHDAAPRAIRRPEAVIDLRSEPPVRHRQSRGVPREPDELMRSYRNRPAPPGARPPQGRSIAAAAAEIATPHFTREAPLVPDAAATDDVTAEAGVPAGPEPAPRRATTALHPEPRATPSATTAPAGMDRRRTDVGQLVVARLRLRSVGKVALTFYLCLLAVVMVAGVVLWDIANQKGWVQGWTGFLVDVGFSDAAVDGSTLLRASATAGGILVVTATALTVVAAFFYNQLSGIIGGVEVTLAPRRQRLAEARARRRDRTDAPRRDHRLPRTRRGRAHH